MKPINYYTSLSVETEETLDRLDLYGKLRVAQRIVDSLIERSNHRGNDINLRMLSDIEALNFNQALGLIKALADQCQETLISK